MRVGVFPFAPLQLAHGVGAEPRFLRQLLLGEACGLAVAPEVRAESFVSSAWHVVVVLLLASMVARLLTRTEWVSEWAVLVVVTPPRTQTESREEARGRRATCSRTRRGTWRTWRSGQ